MEEILSLIGSQFGAAFVETRELVRFYRCRPCHRISFNLTEEREERGPSERRDEVQKYTLLHKRVCVYSSVSI